MVFDTGRLTMNRLNYDAISVQDCIDMYEKKDKTTIINNGKVVGFDEKERMNKNNEQD